MPLRLHLLIGGLLLVSEAWFGVGILGMGVGMVAAIVALASAVAQKGQRTRLLGVAAVYALLCVGTMGIILSNWRVAQRRAVPVITAIYRFRSDYGHYPAALDKLVPVYLPSIPEAGFTVVGRHFGYLADRPSLYFSAMFHGIAAYDFSTRGWRTNE